MKANEQKLDLEDACKNLTFHRYNKKKKPYLIFMISIMIAIILQEIIAIIDLQLSSNTTDFDSEYTNLALSVTQITGTFGIIFFYLGVIHVSLKSPQKAKSYSRPRWLILVAFNIYSLQVSVIPRQNSGNFIGAQITMLELILLDVGSLLYELDSLFSGILIVLTNIIFISQTSYSQLHFLLPFIAINIVALVYFYFHCKTEKEIMTEIIQKLRNGEIYQSFLNLLPEGVAILMEGPSLKYVNSSMQRILNCPEENIIKCLFDLKNVDVKMSEEKKLLLMDTDKMSSDSQPIKHQLDSSDVFNMRSLVLKNSINPDDIVLNSAANGRMSEASDMVDDKAKAFTLNNWNEMYMRAKSYDKSKHRHSLYDQMEMARAAQGRIPYDESSHNQTTTVHEKEKSSLENSPFVQPANKPTNFLQINRPQPKNQNKIYLGLERTELQENRTLDNFIGGKRSFDAKLKAEEEGVYDASPMSMQESSLMVRQQGSGFPSGRMANHVFSNFNSQNKALGSQVMSSPKSSGDSYVDMTFKTPFKFRIVDDRFTQKSSESNDNNSPAFHETQKQFNQDDPNVTSAPLRDPNDSKSIFKPWKSNSNPMDFFAEADRQQKYKNEVDSPGTENTMNRNKIKELKSFLSKHHEIRSAYESLMNRLNDNREEADSPPTPPLRDREPKKFGFLSCVRRVFKRREPLNSKDNSPTLQKLKKKEKIKLRMDENDYCIVINSKLRVAGPGGAKERFLEVKLSPTFIDNKPCILALVKDTTERDMINRLKETDNYKNTLLASVSHELRTPLNCMISMQEMLKKYISEDLVLKYLNPSINSSKLLLCLVNDILDFAQIRAGKLRQTYEEFSLQDVLRDALTLFEIQCKNRNLEIRLEWDPRIPPVFYSDPNRIRQVIVNLVGNAIKFTLKGSITLKASYKGPRRVGISVNDTGVGIKKEDIKRIFSSFGKIINNDLNPRGVGLGLTISQTIARKLGPKGNKGIEVESTVGIGSCFYFMLESFEKKVKRKKQQRSDEEIKFDSEEYNGRNDLDMSSVEEEDPDVVSEKDDIKPGQNMELLRKMTDVVEVGRTKNFNVTEMSATSRFQRDGPPGNIVPSKHKSSFDIVTANRNEKIDINDQAKTSPVKFPFPSRPSQSIIDTANVGRMSDLSFNDNKDKTQTVDESTPINVTSPLRKKLDTSQVSLDQSKELNTKAQSKTTEFKATMKAIADETASEPQSMTQNIPRLSCKKDSPEQIRKSSTIINTKTCSCEDFLIVDDNDFNLLALRQLLESFKFGVVCALNGEIAINLIKEKSKSSCCKAFKIVFMDCDMPVKNGYDATRELKNMQKAGELPPFPIIATTAYVNNREVNYCFECGMDAYLNKPVMKEKLKEIIKQWYKK